MGRGLGAVDRAAKSRFEQIGDAADVIDVDVRDDQCLNAIQRKIDCGIGMQFCISTLKQAAVDQEGPFFGQMNLMTRSRYAISRTMVNDLHV